MFDIAGNSTSKRIEELERQVYNLNRIVGTMINRWPADDPYLETLRTDLHNKFGATELYMFSPTPERQTEPED